MKEAPKELLILHGPQPSSADLNLCKLAEFLKVPVRRCSLETPFSQFWRGIVEHSHSGNSVICASAATLGRWLDPSVDKGEVGLPPGPPARLFVYGFDAGARDAVLLRALSRGNFKSGLLAEEAGNQYAVANNFKSFCREFSGLTFGKVNCSNDVVFEGAHSTSSVEEYIRIAGRPFVVGIPNGSSFVVLAGIRQIGDIDSCFPRGVRLLDWFSAIIVPMLFLRHAFGDRCWHGPRKLASFIVDDPLLKSRYGFLEYHLLLQAMEQSNFATSLAFIPWNYRRSQSRVVDLFKQHPDRFSLSVHGCDHTKNEFGATDEHVLQQKGRTALQKMEAHRQLTGVPFDRVMVFPGGHFSAATMKALKATNYLAAVNSTEFAVDAAPYALRLRDVLDLAVTRYCNFALFIRRYPNCIAEFALDFFLGKPALVAAHHDYFKNGYDKIRAFAEQINRLSEGVAWCGLEQIVRRACLQRQAEDGSVQVRCYSNELVLENSAPDRLRFNVWRALEQDARLPVLTINGKELTARRVDAGFSAECELNPGQRGEIKANAPALTVQDKASPVPALHNAKVFLRRRLCEFRDNYVSRSEVLTSSLGVMNRLRKLL